MKAHPILIQRQDLDFTLIQIPPFQKAKILVVGDIILDRYLSGPINRISPEAPVPIVEVTQTSERPGGAANVALNIKALGAEVILLGIVGQDKEAQSISHMLTQAGIETHLIETQEPTIQKTRIVSSRQQLVRLDIEKPLTPRPDQLLSAYQQLLPQANTVVLSDYAKGTLCNPAALIQAAKAQNIPVLVDPKAKDFSIYDGATLITPNTKELEATVGKCETEASMIEKGMHLLNQHHLSALLVTRGINGMMLLSHREPPFLLKALAQEVFDVTGAGDTVIATLATSLAVNADLKTAVTLSNTAAGISVRKPGTSTVSIHELRRALQNQSAYCSLLKETELLAAVREAKACGEKIILTNGCFDLIHAGHITYLEAAKSLGNRLIIAVNDDASVARLKGDGRPVHSLEHRMLVLSGLRSVDWVVPFSEDTPSRLIELIKPDVLVKGGDYVEAQIAGATFVRSYGGDVTILPLLPNCSTTATIQKINSCQNNKKRVECY